MTTVSSESGDSQKDFASKWRQDRACARCRRLKMKCAFDGPSFQSCKRCYSIGVECSADHDPTAQFAKKRSRRPRIKFEENVSPGISSEAIVGNRNSDQISQLQNLVKLVATSLSSLEHDISVTSAVTSNDAQCLRDLSDDLKRTVYKVSNLLEGNNVAKLKQFQDYHKSPSMKHYPYIPFSSNLAKKIVETHNLVSLDEFKVRHKFFLDEMLPYYPIVSLSQNLSDFDWLYENEPLLLTGCVYVTTINDNGLYSTIEDKYMSNEALNQMLNYYLESSISYHVYIKSDGFTYQLVDLCLILSLWCLPTTTSGHFKNQLNLLIGFNISLCIDLGDISKFSTSKMANATPLLPDNSEQRNHLRAFLSVYVSCGSLGLSLPRFKLVTWTRQHETAISFLLKEGEVDGVKLPTRHDTYLTSFSKVIRLGQELFEFFSPDLLFDQSSVSKRKDAVFTNMLDPFANSLPHIKFILDNYEQRLHSLLEESGFMTSPDSADGVVHPKEKYLLSIIYYQLLMIAYDNIVSKYFVLESKNRSETTEHVTYVQYVVKLIKLCESLLKSFIELGKHHTINLPTFFFYRPMHALILLIKLRILIKSSVLSKRIGYVSPDDLEINAEQYFDSAFKLIQESQHKYSSIVCARMAIILARIEKWMTLSRGKGEDNVPSPRTQGPRTEGEKGSDLVNLIDTSKEIENLRAPKEDEMLMNPHTINSTVSSGSGMESVSQTSQHSSKAGSFGVSGGSVPSTLDNLYANSIKDIFNVMDSDILNYINPLDANIDFDSSNFDFSGLQNNNSGFNDTGGFDIYQA